jgi:solute carrier family 13 (sodium-dependent dicarboxylate transporter), member 2/3/5
MALGRLAGAGSGPGYEPSRKRIAGLIIGILLLVLTFLLPPPAGMSGAAWHVAGIASLMAAWWVTEALPVAATALVPVVAFPMAGVGDIREATAPYANPLIFLFLGGFMLALALERWNLHRRIALTILNRVGARPAALVAGFLITTASLSMWVSNTATAMMMLPIGLSVIRLLHTDGVVALPEGEDRNFAVALLLGIAYGATIGGLGTLIGTPPNALLAAYMAETHGVSIGFGQWMLLGVPMVVIMLPLAWLVLTRVAFPVGGAAIPGAQDVIAREFGALGPMRPPETRVAVIFAATAALWMIRPAINHIFPALSLSDPAIAVGAALVLFAIPANAGNGECLLNWDWAKRLPWGVLILFGGGLSLAAAISQSGLAQWIGQAMATGAGWPLFFIVLLIAFIVIFLTEITSNTATAAVFLPLVAAFALSIGASPITLMVPVALAASCAFMMPVATPPNAIVFASGAVTIPHMARAGLLLNLAAIFLIVLTSYSLVPLVFGTGGFGAG